MCLRQSSIIGMEKYNWEGDRIIHKCIVPSHRTVQGSNKKNYNIDVREFLISDKNELMRKAVREDIKKYLTKKLKGKWQYFQSRDEGSFDYRANVVSSFVAENIHYQIKNFGEPWLFPDETLYVEAGDCEDRAFLMASLMIASGISSYNVRVAFGKVKLSSSGNDSQHVYDHAWVMYKNEKGRWMIFEPLNVKNRSASSVRDGVFHDPDESMVVEYIPSYLFNDAHLWMVNVPELKMEDSKFSTDDWKKFDPTFAGQIHKSIVIDGALNGVAPAWVLDGLKRYFISVPFSSKMLDIVDSPFSYDPRDHFDNGFIDEGWDRVNFRLKKFNDDNRDLRRFAYAAHAIADFYAHTSYIHFARPDSANRADDAVEIYDHQNPNAGFLSIPDYSTGSSFDLTSNNYSYNNFYWKKSKADIPKEWNGKIISGRYAQISDSHDFVESIVQIPNVLQSQTGFYLKGSLPHHNEIAVDEPSMPANSPHKLYSRNGNGSTDAKWFNNQFRWRKNTAINHVRKVFVENWHG